MKTRQTFFLLPSFKIRSSFINKFWKDTVLLIALMFFGGLFCFWITRFLPPELPQTFDVWFQSDQARVFENMLHRNSNHYRTQVHPLFSLLVVPPTYILKILFQLQPAVAVHLVLAAIAALWFGTLLLMFRLMGCQRLDAVLLTLLGGTSAASVFWIGIPETYALGSLSIVLSFCFIILAQSYQFSSLGYIGISAVTLSVTTTNWIFGIVATAINHRWLKTLRISAIAFLLVSLLWILQKVLFPTAKYFLDISSETEYMLESTSGGPLQVIQSFIAHTMVMPSINIAKLETLNGSKAIMLTQASTPGSGTAFGGIAVGLWLALLGLGVWQLFVAKHNLKLRIALGVTLIGQLLLHIVYGSETFLYSLHFLPLLLLLVALGTLAKTRYVSLSLIIALILTAGINNGIMLKKAAVYSVIYSSPRNEVKAQIKLRPTDPWPRGTGHVVLALPGTQEEDKSYHEPGGSFSPVVNSFGVSIWLVDPEGNLKKTSDTIPTDEIQQQFLHFEGETLPQISTQTNDYKAVWSSPQTGQWQLHLTGSSNPTTKPVIVIRSVGPAGGPVRSLNWTDQQLKVNDRWLVSITPKAEVYLGDERESGWSTAHSSQKQWNSNEGWGYARFELTQGNDWILTINDTAPTAQPEVLAMQTKSALTLNLPSQQFIDSLNAQVAHLMMGLVGLQTRPGEPTNYPLPWLRDGAHSIVSLARSGQLEVAKQLSTYFAENDFFGGFGPEADAPGLAIWSLEEVAKQLQDPDFDRWLWPHIYRKAEFIIKMLKTDEPIHQPVTSPVIPSMEYSPELTLVADPARDGLIVGRMDHHRPLLYINALSYRGLLDAASLAERLGCDEDAKRWQAHGLALKQAWEKAFKPPESENERTYTTALWPTWIAADLQKAFHKSIQDHWMKRRDDQGNFLETPLWTYFDVAEAHQWLFLGQPDQAWNALRWFWNHQASPGLYTWWEGDREENTSHRWEQVRGWINPPHVTPHYWTAAEMLNFQLDMLAYLDQSTQKPTLVIGAGIPPSWLSQPMDVEGLSMSGYRIDWHWDAEKMQVSIHGDPINVELGPEFPSDTPLTIEFLDSATA